MDLGASRRGVDMGPSALRVADLARRLEALGHDVEADDDVSAALPEVLLHQSSPLPGPVGAFLYTYRTPIRAVVIGGGVLVYLLAAHPTGALSIKVLVVVVLLLLLHELLARPPAAAPDDTPGHPPRPRDGSEQAAAEAADLTTSSRSGR